MEKAEIKKLPGDNWQLILNSEDMANLLNMTDSLYSLTSNTTDCNVEVIISDRIHEALEHVEDDGTASNFVCNALLLKAKFADLAKRLCDLRVDYERQNYFRKEA